MGRMQKGVSLSSCNSVNFDDICYNIKEILGGKLPNLSTFVYSTDWVEIELLSMTNQ
jgi:hypothetical protein